MASIGTYIKVSLLFVSALLAGSCVDPYRPPAIADPDSYLVVDGFLTGDTGVSTIRLSRTQNLTEIGKPRMETKASVQAEGDNGNLYRFVDENDGTYTLAGGSLQFNQPYRVRIKTANGRDYLSDYVTIKQTPKIDSLSWQPQDQGVQFYVTTHDPANKTRYYRWEYEETWESYSAFISRIEYKAGRFYYRTVNTNRCWRGAKSTDILVATSAQLTQDVISQFPTLYVSATASNRLKDRYSLLVKQYALTEEAYEYWPNLKKNTEKLGTLFDPQPFQVIGNIHGVTDPNEPVIGYIGGYSVEEKRIFINQLTLPRWPVPTGYENCPPADTIPILGAPLKADNEGWEPINEIRDRSNRIVAYTMAPGNCVDCRFAGTNVKPNFW